MTRMIPKRNPWVRIPAGLVVFVLLLVRTPAMVLAADNLATGNVAGNAGSLNTSNTVTLNTATLSLVKAAFLTDGTPLASGATVPSGTPVHFLIYIDNTTSVPTDSVNVQDNLAAGFAYVPGTIRVDNSQATLASVANIYNAVITSGTAVSDPVSGTDVAGISGTIVSAGDSSGNTVLTFAPSRVWAMLFTVKMQ